MAVQWHTSSMMDDKKLRRLRSLPSLVNVCGLGMASLSCPGLSRSFCQTDFKLSNMLLTEFGRTGSIMQTIHNLQDFIRILIRGDFN